MLAATFAAIAAFQMILFREYDIAFRAEVVFILGQFIFLRKARHIIAHTANLADICTPA